MFRSFMGLPLHPLAVHAAVIFVPMLVLGSAGYALLPRFRSRLGWLLWGFAVVAPVSAVVAVESGERLQDVLIEKHYSAKVLDQVSTHAGYARLVAILSIGLGLATILQLVFVGTPRGERLPRWVTPVLVSVVLAVAVADVVFVYLTGDSGAKATWTGVL